MAGEGKALAGERFSGLEGQQAPTRRDTPTPSAPPAMPVPWAELPQAAQPAAPADLHLLVRHERQAGGVGLEQAHRQQARAHVLRAGQREGGWQWASAWGWAWHGLASRCCWSSQPLHAAPAGANNCTPLQLPAQPCRACMKRLSGSVAGPSPASGSSCSGGGMGCCQRQISSNALGPVGVPCTCSIYPSALPSCSGPQLRLPAVRQCPTHLGVGDVALGRLGRRHLGHTGGRSAGCQAGPTTLPSGYLASLPPWTALHPALPHPHPAHPAPPHLDVELGALADGAKLAAQDGGEAQVQRLRAVPGARQRGAPW